jgi:integrase
LLYGTGLRISEALQLRVKDLDFAHQAVIVRAGKGDKDRVVMLPQSLAPALRSQLAQARLIWAADVEADRAGVEMPSALERKYPRAGQSWAWFWVFPQDHHATDPRTGVVRRHHLYDHTFQRAFKPAAVAAGISKPATPARRQRLSNSHALSSRFTLTGCGVRSSWANRPTRSSSSSQR